MRPLNPLPRFIVFFCGWLVVGFVLWYHSTTLLMVPFAAILNALLVGDWISEVNAQGDTIEVVTRLAVSPVGVFAFDINPLLYTYNSAFFFALILATPIAWLSKFHQLLWSGLCVLLPAHILSIIILVYQTLLLKYDTGLTLPSWQLNGLALAYQASSLLVPILLPVVLWGVLNQAYLTQLVFSKRSDSLDK